MRLLGCEIYGNLEGGDKFLVTPVQGCPPQPILAFKILYDFLHVGRQFIPLISIGEIFSPGLSRQRQQGCQIRFVADTYNINADRQIAGAAGHIVQRRLAGGVVAVRNDKYLAALL